MEDRRFWEELRANAELAVREGEEGVRLRGGQMDGWLVKHDAPAFAPDWYKTWPESVAERHEADRYMLAEGGTWAEWGPLEASTQS